jgi:hypothetical protein
MKSKQKPTVEYGYVVERMFAPRQGGGSMGFICDYDKAPKDSSTAVGVNDLAYALFYTDYRKAADWLTWVLDAKVREARRVNGRIEVLREFPVTEKRYVS